MSKLNEYISITKEKTKNLSDIEKIRYVYLDLGKRFNFDLDFSFGNSKNKQKIYQKSRNEENLNKCMEENKIICKSLSYIFEKVLKSIGIKNVETVKCEDDTRKWQHTYNVIELYGKEYTFDLQEDMRNIKTNLRTKCFGKSINAEEDIVSRYSLEQIDKKLGNIKKDKYYTDGYLELIKINADMFDDFSEKVQFVIENMDSHTEKDIGYADRRWRMEDLVENRGDNNSIFSDEEKNKLQLVDCYKEIGGNKKFELCIVAKVKCGIDIYLFSEKENRFLKTTIDNFAKMVENGLIPMQGIPGLKKVLRQRKNNLEER